MSEFCKVSFSSEGSVTILGKNISYRTTSENFPVSRTDEAIEASTFTFAYERNDLPNVSARPVLFAWNGGPSCSSVYMHMGLLAPQKIKSGNGIDISRTAPFELMENTHCLLDVCDIVLVDPVNSGYSRIYSQDSYGYWMSSTGDAVAMVATIRQWLSTHGRWNSPLYIAGESYGTARNALVSALLYTGCRYSASLHLSGVIMIGSYLNCMQEPFPVPVEVLSLPSVAAANWYWHREGKGSLAEYVDRCEEFAYSRYLYALAMGNALLDTERQSIAEELSYFTGYSVPELLDKDLLVDASAFSMDTLSDEKKAIGLYDARFATSYISKPAVYDFDMDPGNVQSMTALIASMNCVLKENLGVHLDEEYRHYAINSGKDWNFKTALFPPSALEIAMARNPDMKLMFCIGYYDMVTTLGWCRYLVRHYQYPKDHLWMKYYESGHMPYAGDLHAKQLLDDMRSFIISPRNEENIKFSSEKQN